MTYKGIREYRAITLTTGTDLADAAGAYRNGSGTPFDFKFTAGNETVNGDTTTLTAGDSLADGSSVDSDVLNVGVSGPTNLRSVVNIETINLTTTGATGASAITYGTLTGLKTLNVSGSAAGDITFTNGGTNDIGNTGVTTIDATGLTTNVGIVVNSSLSTATAALTVKGAFGADTITGGLGADVLSGNDGNDAIAGGAGADTINGGNGADFLQGQNDADTVNGDAGVDNIDGGAAADTLNGGAGNDVIVTTAGNDAVTGGAGNDTIALGSLGVALAANTVAGGIVDTTTTAGESVVGANATTAAGNNTVYLEGSLADNGVDQIIGFTIGATDAATGGDILNVSKFLGKAVTNYVEISGTDGAADNVTGSNVVVITNATFAAARADDGGAAGDVGVVLGANAKTVVVEFFETTAAGALDNAVVRYVTTDANGTIVGNDVVATLVGVTADATNSIAALVAGNFA